MSDENVRFKFDLDAKDAVNQALSLKDAITSIGDSKNLTGLIQGFTAVAGPLFVAGAALFAVKKLMDFTKEGESIQRIEKTFESLTTQYNLSSEALLSGLKKSTKGMIDMDEITQSANKAITLLGANAAKLPEIMNLARIAGKRFGVDTLDAFDSINQAIASGATRRLRQIGLIVNAQEAEIKYAKSIGTTVGLLSEQGKQTALMNEVLEKGQKKFKDSGGEAGNFTIALKQLWATTVDLYDKFVVFVSSGIVGKFFAEATYGATKFLKIMTGTKTASDDVAELERNIAKTSASIKKMQDEQEARKGRNGLGAIWGQLVSGEGADTILDQNIRGAKERLQRDSEALAKLKEEIESKEPKDKSKAPDAVGSIDKDKALLATAQFNRQLLQLKESRLNAEMAIETNEFEYAQDLELQRLNIASQYDARIAEIKAKAARADGISAAEANAMILQIEGERAAKIEEMKIAEQDKQLSVYDNQLKAAKTTAEGIKAAFSQAGAQATRDLQNYGKQGQAAFNIVNTSAKKFFIGLGEGSKDASQLMREFLFGMLADYAEQQGSVLLAEGIGTGNGVAIAEGGALLALSGLIRSMAGGGGGSSGGGSSGGGGSSSPSTSPLEKPSLDDTKKKSVTIEIQGNYFETEQTKTRLVEMIRETSDATDYTVKQIGVK